METISGPLESMSSKYSEFSFLLIIHNLEFSLILTWKYQENKHLKIIYNFSDTTTPAATTPVVTTPEATTPEPTTSEPSTGNIIHIKI